MEENNQPPVNGPKKNMVPLIVLIIIILVAIGGFAIYKSMHKPTTQTADQTLFPDDAAMEMSGDTSTEPMDMGSSTPTTTTTSTPVVANGVKSFTITGANFSFTPNEIRVKKGDTVKITFKNSDGFHDFVLEAFNVRTPQIGTGKTADVTFTADKTGTFEYYCSVGQHRQMGMKGNLIVE